MSNCQKWRSKVKKRSWTNNGMFSKYFTSCRFQFAKRPPYSGRMQENTDQKHSKYGYFFTQWSSKKNFVIVLLIQIGFHVTLMLFIFFIFVEKSLEKKIKPIGWFHGRKQSGRRTFFHAILTILWLNPLNMEIVF